MTLSECWRVLFSHAHCLCGNMDLRHRGNSWGLHFRMAQTQKMLRYAALCCACRDSGGQESQSEMHSRWMEANKKCWGASGCYKYDIGILPISTYTVWRKRSGYLDHWYGSFEVSTVASPAVGLVHCTWVAVPGRRSHGNTQGVGSPDAIGCRTHGVSHKEWYKTQDMRWERWESYQ